MNHFLCKVSRPSWILSLYGIFGLLSFHLPMVTAIVGAAQKTPEASKAYSVKIHWAEETNGGKRNIAGTNGEGFAIHYATYKGVHEDVEVIDAEAWRQFSPGKRLDRLVKFYFANTRERSRQKLVHNACFDGPLEGLDVFFGGPKVEGKPRTPPPIANFRDDLLISASVDQLMVGLEFGAINPGDQKYRYFHFRMSACHSAGKNALVQKMGYDRRRTEKSGSPSGTKTTKLGNHSADREKPLDWSRLPAVEQRAENGVDITDLDNPPFSINAEYETASGSIGDLPYLKEKLNLNDKEDKDAKDAMKFAKMMQKHFYEHMATQDPGSVENNFVARASTRYWCHMPWLNVGNAGREGLHGLTNERALQKSPVYPNATPGSNWGIGYYNAEGCTILNKIFGTRTDLEKNPGEVPKWASSLFPDGTVSVKILFTTAVFNDLQGAYIWKANVSLPNSTERKPRDVRHLQMDIAVKDSRLLGARPDADHWIMLTYYYDKTYKDNLGILGLHEGLQRMRPMGIQLGFDSPNLRETILFPNSRGQLLTNQDDGKLNGPADNPRSSCLGCHGTAGTNVGMAPGIKTAAEFNRVRGRGMDFSQQVALAKRNFETRRIIVREGNN